MLDLLILIKSAITHRSRRMIIRNLWANNQCWGNLIVRHVFVLGTVKSISDVWLKLIDKESQQFGDLIQGNFIDNYYNNTHKMIFSIRWAIAFCPETRWYLFVDDDFFIDTRLFSVVLKQLDPRLSGRLVIGDLARASPVLRRNLHRSKWTVSYSLYPQNTYPKFVQAGIFLMGASMALDVYVGSRFTRFFPFDDVFIGLVLNKLLRRPIHLNHLILTRPRADVFYKVNKSLALHGVYSPGRQRSYWRSAKLQQMCLKKNTSVI
ncbi:unnamed protein product [Echinostoma caproni]|uniref:Hexosyltransferase n=1 Tax=Echinostoma caproni TaxID=27848 RepID=A0A183BA59_9TREM|nr:unnamed protein product [Echinostoma caproni]